MISQINYPRTLDGNIDFRISLTEKCKKDRELAEDVWKYCALNLIFWVEVFCWTKDPRRKPDILPFICFDAYQEETLREIERAINNQEDELFDKSRDMGLSWMVLYVFQHKWLFEAGSDFKLGSRKEEYVDKPGDIDTLFEKLRFNLRLQPTFIIPPGFKWDKHSTYMKLINPVNGNNMIGESANVNFGTGGRKKAIFMDEFSKWDRGIDNGAWTSTADVSKCRIPVSTPFGSAGKFAMLAEGTQEKVKRYSIHWTLHPAKASGCYYYNLGEKIEIDLSDNPRRAFELWKQGVEVRSPWYDIECERRSKQDIAQELDIDYLSSGRPYFDLKELSLQKAWPEFKFKTVADVLPYGKYISVDLVDIDNRIEERSSRYPWLRVYERPDEFLEYIIACDSSEGLAKGDESFLVVREKISRNVVACANGLWKPEEFAQKTFLVEKYFRIKPAGAKRVTVVPENNNMGFATTQELVNIGSNVYWCTKTGVKDGRIVEERDKPGFVTSLKTRPIMCAQGEEEIRKHASEIRYEIILKQMKTFVTNAKSGKPEADGDFHDDGVVAWLIGGYVIARNPYKPKAEGKSEAFRQSKQKELVKTKRNAGFSYA